MFWGRPIYQLKQRHSSRTSEGVWRRLKEVRSKDWLAASVVCMLWALVWCFCIFLASLGFTWTCGFPFGGLNERHVWMLSSFVLISPLLFVVTKLCISGYGFQLLRLGLFPASLLWFLFVVSPLPYRFVVTQVMGSSTSVLDRMNE